MRARTWTTWLWVTAVASTGCALTTKARPLEVHYFTVDAADGATAPRKGATKLSLGHVTSSAFLRNRIVFRQPSDELGTYEEWRWTEYPESYLRRSLNHTLFEKGRFVEGLGTNTPTLDVELIAFEEVRRDGARAGRVQLGYRLRQERAVLASGVVTVERPAAASGDMRAIVAAISAALAEATRQVGAVVEAHYAAPH